MAIFHRFGKLSELIFTFCLLAILLTPNLSFGEMYMGITVQPEEFVLLPRWCQIRLLMHPKYHHNNGATAVRIKMTNAMIRENDKWEKKIGALVYNSSHHYIFGLNWINRYKYYSIRRYKGVEKDLDKALTQALEEFNYMRGQKENLKKTPIYYPMLIHEAYVYKLRGALGKAANNYLELIKLKPSDATNYVECAMLFNTMGKKMDAKKILNDGLQNTGGADIIKKAINTIG